MPVASERDKARTLTAQHEILRSIECLSGEIAVIVHYAPRPNYARDPVRLRDRGPLGIHLQHGAQLFALRSEIPLQVSSEGLDAHAEVTLRQGDRRHLSLTFSDMEPGVLASLGASAEEKIRASVEWWRGWAAGCAYQGPYRAAVMRSALVLKLLTYAPSGAVIAAPTTSLPEKPGGVRNWDYRYCWLRDASLTLQALHDLGYLGEAQAHMAWLLHATRLTWPRLRLMYDVFGRPDLPEECLDHLAGFAGSRPVRIGNAATRQLQLDVYGELLDAVYQFTQRGGRLDRTTARMLRGFGETVCRCWREPDEGIWETRGGRRHHTFSRVMCWVALDRLLKLHEAGHVRIARDRLSAVRDEIRQDVERRGFDESLQSYVAVLDGNAVDASLLQLARYGYVDARSTRMRGTLQVVRSRLGRDGLIYRYRAGDDGLPSGEGAFGICGFWAVDALARSGDVAEAVRAFEHLLKYANDVGLYAEETAPESGAALGNFPQAFTHVGLICAALTLAQASGASS
jgi:GH15 family glucan-1,4-alpha-glucosidase